MTRMHKAKSAAIATLGVDIGKNTFHLMGRPSKPGKAPCQSRVMTITLKSLSSLTSYWPSLHFASSTSKTPVASVSFSVLPPEQPQACKAAWIFSASAGDTGVSASAAKLPAIVRAKDDVRSDFMLSSRLLRGRCGPCERAPPALARPACPQRER